MSDIVPGAITALIQRARTVRGIAPEHYLVSERSIAQLLDGRAVQSPDAPFITYYNDDTGERHQLSYGEFNRRVNQYANYLTGELGVKRGETIASLAHNHPIPILLCFACWKIGAVIAPQNVSEDDTRIGFILHNAECRVLLAMVPYAERARAIEAQVPGLQKVVTLDEAFEHVLSRHGQDFSPPAIDMLEDEALLVYTSGTTGAPKGVMLTQYNLLVDAQAIVHSFQMTEATRLMCVLPVHHVNGLIVTHVAPLICGASVVLNRGFKASVFWQRLAQEKVQIVSVVPTILQFLCEGAEEPGKWNLSGFRHFACGAGTLPIALVERFDRRFGFKIVHGYGLSETTAFCCLLPLDLTKEQHHHWLTHYQYPSLGCAADVNEMTIHDAEGRELSAGERGEIVIRGPNVMMGYFKRDDANLDTFKFGWFRSGDEGFYQIDHVGRKHFFITGRLKELINRGGVKYSPFEIEEVLLTIPGVKVGLAIAFENDWYGEEVGAYVVKEEGANVDDQTILRACRGKMAFSKSPKVVVFGAEVPVTATGKWQRLKLRELFADHRGTQFKEAKSS